jgi:hypothetical protein
MTKSKNTTNSVKTLPTRLLGEKGSIADVNSPIRDVAALRC